MKKGKNIQSNSSQKESVQAGDSGSGLAIGLSLGVLIGIIIDDIGLGMMLGVPCMSVIYTVLREKVDGMPKRKNDSGKKRPHQKLRIPFFSKRTPASAEAEAPTAESPEPEANATESSES